MELSFWAKVIFAIAALAFGTKAAAEPTARGDVLGEGDVVWLETPRNPDCLVYDIAAYATAARAIGGVRVVVDPKSALYVTGSELDYIEALTDGGFKVHNPNAATTCSCGESFSA